MATNVTYNGARWTIGRVVAANQSRLRCLRGRWSRWHICGLAFWMAKSYDRGVHANVMTLWDGSRVAPGSSICSAGASRTRRSSHGSAH